VTNEVVWDSQAHSQAPPSAGSRHFHIRPSQFFIEAFSNESLCGHGALHAHLNFKVGLNGAVALRFSKLCCRNLRTNSLSASPAPRLSPVPQIPVVIAVK